MSVQKPGPPTRAAAFTQLHEFLQHDVKNVLRMEHGGNYTAALLLLVGAEALSRIVDAPDDAVFVELLHRRGIDPLSLPICSRRCVTVSHTSSRRSMFRSDPCMSNSS